MLNSPKSHPQCPLRPRISRPGPIFIQHKHKTQTQNTKQYAQVVTSTTHKTLRGPRSGVIFYRRDLAELNLETRINNAVFPGCQVCGFGV
jgi:hypothetical protein